MKIGEDNILRSSAVFVLSQFPAFESAIRKQPVSNRFRDRIIVTFCDFLKFKNFTNSTSKTNAS